MHKLFRIALTISAMSIASTALAQSTTKYDGTYVGLPEVTTGGAQCPQMETASALTITNGAIQSATGSFTGAVSADGHVVLHSKTATRFEGSIDPSGLVKVTGVTTHNCSYTFSWKKR
jgi:hypothetical protein